MKDDTRLVTVCDKCLRASCWHGFFMCDEAQHAGTVNLPVSKLHEINREHPSHYSVKKLKEVYGL